MVEAVRQLDEWNVSVFVSVVGVEGGGGGGGGRREGDG